MNQALDVLKWKPITLLDQCLQYRVHFSDWSFKLDSSEFSPRSNDQGFLLIDHGPQFATWLKEYKIGPYQIVFWGDHQYRWEAANDEQIQTIWSFCFEREIDAILFKLKWV